MMRDGDYYVVNIIIMMMIVAIDDKDFQKKMMMGYRFIGDDNEYYNCNDIVNYNDKIDAINDDNDDNNNFQTIIL